VHKTKTISQSVDSSCFGIWTQPHGNSYFLPRKIAGKSATFLLDSGCTTNLISHQLFDTLSAKVSNVLEPYDEEYGTLADGSCMLQEFLGSFPKTNV